MIGLLLLAQAAAASQPQVRDAPATVVVTGRRPDHDKAVRHMTARAAAVGDAGHPLARFSAPICPEVGGLPPPFADQFADRMRQDARGTGIAVAQPGCAPNIVVLFVPSGQAVVRRLRDKGAALFGSLEADQIRRLANDAGPIHLWSFTDVRSRDDDRLRVGTTTGREVPELQVRSASILEAPIRIVVEGAVLLIDQEAAVGKTIAQLADYAVMRTVAQALPVGDAAAEPTILGLFDRSTPAPRSLTAVDAAYLGAAYRGTPTSLPFTKVGLIARSINRSLAAAVAETKAASPTP